MEDSCEHEKVSVVAVTSIYYKVIPRNAAFALKPILET